MIIVCVVEKRDGKTAIRLLYHMSFAFHVMYIFIYVKICLI